MSYAAGGSGENAPMALQGEGLRENLTGGGGKELTAFQDS